MNEQGDAGVATEEAAVGKEDPERPAMVNRLSSQRLGRVRCTM